MAITINKSVLNNVEIRKDTAGKLSAMGNYSLITEKGTEVASQSFGGYMDSKFTPSPRTVELMLSYYDSLSHDVSEFVGTN